MPDLFRDKEHLVRMAALFAAGLLAFLVLRAVLVPKGFGEFGHYRAGSLIENRSLPQRFAGRTACGECHDDVAAERAVGGHAGIGCEACHGALGAHAQDPAALQPDLPEAMPLCLGCHRTSVAKPTWFPQVDPAEHGEGEACDLCHLPHHPDMEEEGS